MTDQPNDVVEGTEPEPRAAAPDTAATDVAAAGAVAPEAPRRRGLAAKVRIAVIVFLALGALGFSAEWVTSSPKVCMSCHEMSLQAGSWKQSAHANVECVACHQPPRAWYAFPLTLTDRFALLGRDVYRHFSSDYDDPVDSRPAGAEPMPADVCLQCHDPNRKATSGFRILIDHPEHAKRNGPCVSCHVRTAHPIAERGIPLSLMAQCYTCHGTKEYPKASTECAVCHPSGYELVPASHKEAKWKRGHGDIWKVDAKQCALCHENTYCTDCHGLDMPHPADWAQKNAVGHAAAAEKNREVCVRCHEEPPDLCGSCHHTAWDAAKGPWKEQHFEVARTDGTTTCLSCHEANYCVRCHVTYATEQ